MKMKTLKRIFLILLVVVVAASISAYVYMNKQAPQYEGTIQYEGLHKNVEVIFDDYGIPHIYAQNNEDAYFALGFAVAQERLFQMEMVRRLIAGRLAEFLGEGLVKTDTYFRTLGLRKEAERLANIHVSERKTNLQKEWHAYMDGVNHFIKTETLPVEYQILGIEAEEYTSEDAFSALVYMSLGFAGGYKDDMIFNQINTQLGDNYLKDWYMNYSNYQDSITSDTSLLTMSKPVFMPELPLPIWTGSNAWVIAASKTVSGKTILANDTHVAYSQPAIWYEAHIEYPGFSFYGNYLAGVPFASVGNNRDVAWGLTIFPMDITDIYIEKINPDNENQVWDIDHWTALDVHTETIKVKDADDVELTIKKSKHGPIVNGVFDGIGDKAAAFWWSLFDLDGNNFHAFYNFAHAKNMDDARAAAKQNDILGLNVLYADKDDNIAWWASGKMPIRPAHVNPALFLDGSTGKDDFLGYHDFSKNPHEENPERGFIVSSNHEPVFTDVKIPGNYLPPNRFERLTSLLSQKKKWDLEDMGELHGDVKSIYFEKLAHYLVPKIKVESIDQAAIDLLKNWEGDYPLDGIAPTIFTKLMHHLCKNTMEDELGEATFERLLGSYALIKTMSIMFYNEDSPWWDNTTTPEKEQMSEILNAAFKTSMEELRAQLGADINQWQWKKVHSLTHIHPIGRVAPFDKIFNVGPFPVMGNTDSPNKAKFVISGDGLYKSLSGPAIRRLIDFGDVDHGLNILPTGQSGNVMSPHYNDQAEMYNLVKYRSQLMDKTEIEQFERRLIFEKE